MYHRHTQCVCMCVYIYVCMHTQADSILSLCITANVHAIRIIVNTNTNTHTQYHRTHAHTQNRCVNIHARKESPQTHTQTKNKIITLLAAAFELLLASLAWSYRVIQKEHHGVSLWAPFISSFCVCRWPAVCFREYKTSMTTINKTWLHILCVWGMVATWYLYVVRPSRGCFTRRRPCRSWVVDIHTLHVSLHLVPIRFFTLRFALLTLAGQAIGRSLVRSFLHGVLPGCTQKNQHDMTLSYLSGAASRQQTVHTRSRCGTRGISCISYHDLHVETEGSHHQVLNNFNPITRRCTLAYSLHKRCE